MNPMAAPLPFREVWLCDFEYGAESGDRPAPRCLVAHELISRRWLRIWEDELLSLGRCPYAIGEDALLIAYYASAEIGCHLALDWLAPSNVLDLYVEFRNQTNGLELPSGNGLLGALTFFGIDGVNVAEKEAMRQLALRGGPWTDEERKDLLAYCESDVVALERLLSCMLPTIDLQRALFRGKYMVAAARMEHAGIPVDAVGLAEAREAWPHIRGQLIASVDAAFGVFDGETFKQDRFASWLIDRGISWSTTPTGRLALDDDTFRTMVRLHPELAPLHELRQSLSQLRLNDLAIGRDGRNRTMLSAFRSRTGRNQPSNTRSIFGPATWVRGFIRPEPGHGLAYIDYDQQEWGIAAALSGDEAMRTAYESGDAYVAFAAQAGAVPAGATKATHRAERERFKLCALGVQYGMEEATLATRIGQSQAHAADLLRLHRRLYRRYWEWSDRAVDYAMLFGELHTVFGWKGRPGAKPNARSLRNFPIQANGAEMLRLACIYATEDRVEVCAPVHDALLVHAPLEQLDDAVALTRARMADASAQVLDGFQLRTEVKVARFPDRYMDPRGAVMWERLSHLLRDQRASSNARADAAGPARGLIPDSSSHDLVRTS
jgi:DNA polymerase-1